MSYADADDVLRCELDSGKELASLLVEHVCVMGAASCTIPITYRERTYVVSVSLSDQRESYGDE